MKLFLSILLLFLCFLLLPFQKAQADYLHTNGNHLVQNNQTIILQGMELSNFENDCGAVHPYTTHDYDTLKSKWNINEVKIPIQGKWWTGNKPFSRGLCNQDYHGNVYGAVDRALSHGFFVGIKMFHDDNGTTMATHDELVAWQDITTHYKGDPRLFFESYNEPHDVDTNTWRNGGNGFVGMAQLIQAIRTIDPNRLILVDVPGWSSSPGSYINPNDQSTWFTGGNIAYDADFYLRSGDNTQPNGNWDSRFGNLAGVLPVIVGEYGSDDGSCRPLDGLLAYMHAKAAGYSAWTYDTGGNPCNRPRMIDTWSGDPNAYGQAMYAFYRAQTVTLANGTSTITQPTPTTGPVPTPTLIPTINTLALVTVHITGIDAANYALIHIKTPLNTTRQLTLYFYPSTVSTAIIDADIQGKKALIFRGPISWSVDNGLFQNSNFPLAGLTDGTYYVLAKLRDGSIREYLSFPNNAPTITIKGGASGTVNTLSTPSNPIELHLGWITGSLTSLDNSLSATDWNIFRSCYGATPSFVPDGCLDPNWDNTQKKIISLFPGAKNGLLSDLMDDGYVDEYDYNLFLRSMGTTTTTPISLNLIPTPTSLPNITPTPVISPPVNLGNCGFQCTPPMGWNHYNSFGNSISDATVRQIADAIVSSGMKAAGYQYVNIDDTWEADGVTQRLPNGDIPSDPNRFPNIKALADYIHAKGLKFGIYTSPGSRTCNGTYHIASGGHEQHDVTMFANWGVDYIKLDACSANLDIALWKNLIKNSPNPHMYLSINTGNNMGTTAQNYPPMSWRTGQDICGTWYNQQQNNSIGCFDSGALHWGIKQYITSNITQDLQYEKPGVFVDPDMMEIGNTPANGHGTITDIEAQTQLSLWAMWSAPLIAGNDLRNMTAQTKAILTNTDVIAIDQDPLVSPAKKIIDQNGIQVWIKTLNNNGLAVAIVNLTDTTTTYSPNGSFSFNKPFKELWSGQGYTNLPNQVTIPAHGTLVFKTQ